MVKCLFLQVILITGQQKMRKKLHISNKRRVQTDSIAQSMS